MLDPIKTKVLLPEWLLQKKESIPDNQFNSLVKQYLIRYEGYKFLEVQEHFAICERT
jgi:hypothetical protein